ncbi:MAG: flagellar biosynthesis protein FliQ [Chloracidobacterium sp.]|nr:flagellar biosynthesis protein FliQ [Chloracidobacterium sp.]MDW8218025.1 flagellar biosynthesis protein FliQ [Acidobacteriota bacterium]
MQTFLTLANQTLWLILLLSLPALTVSLIVGLVISLLQALTQIQEQTLTFVPKMIATILTLIFFGSWTFTQLITFTQQVMAYIPRVAALR